MTAGDSNLSRSCFSRAAATSGLSARNLAEFQILYGKGIYLNGEMIDLGVLHGFVEKSGAWYAYNGTKIGQGKANSAKFLADNPEVAAALEKQLRDKLLSPAVIADSKASAVKETEDDMADADI